MLWIAFVRQGKNYPHYYRPPQVLTILCYCSIPNIAVSGSQTGRPSLVATIPENRLPDTADAPVGLSDPQYVSQRRQMLDTVNRLRATG
jgi:hypothetical protein